ncbi:MAG: SLBB domain-containing protein [Candidatus Electrothrix aestuarii]|uniref:SLBB domain-containing protein n=1 Tax=Candidatus Electrothrix aestuarii TaxID=3062594 RepID=A0AAU8LZY7_9BACT|nr:SLBB domain-containing protein [Candidatus Electrothrix aestuarii]
MPTRTSNIIIPSAVTSQPQRYNSGTGNSPLGSSIKVPSFKPVIPSFRPAQQASGGQALPSRPLIPGRKANFLPPPVKTGLAGGSPYTVGPQDILTIEVFDNPDLKGEYTVSEKGAIVFPLIGQVKVSGKTPDSIKAELTHLLEKDYLFNPIVSVDVSKYLSRQVKLMGNVEQPGVYYLDGPTRLSDLLTKAGGVSKQLGGTAMSGQKVHITRAPSSSSPDDTITYYVDLHQLLVDGKDEVNIYLQPGDVIFIPDASTFNIIGQVKNSGSFPFEEGLTLLKAISLAGGLTEKGSSDNAVIKRVQNGRVVEMRAGMNTLLSADDTVYIPENLDSFQVMGEVKNSGSFPFKEGTTLLKAIALAGGLSEKAAADDAVIKRVQYGRTVEMRVGMDTLLAPNDTVFIPEDKKFIHVVGEVKHSDSFPYETGITLLNAINYAGGATQKGSAEDAIIKRLSNGRTIEMRGGVDTVLLPGDTVVVPEARSVEVVGEVKSPGSIPYEPRMTLLKAIDLAGGATLEGSPENVVIKRLQNGRVVEIKANMYTSLQPDDTVFVPEVRSFHVTGEVVSPGSYPHESGLTLLRAIAMAGGATKKAAPDDSIIKRLKNGKLEEIEATMDTLVLPDDVIEVPLSFW